MGYFETEEGVDQYLGMVSGPDRGMVERLSRLLPAGATVLEIGMGPGHDLQLLADRYRVVGTDRSPIFVQRFAAQHPGVDVRRVDATALDLPERFDGVYSNKVLQHLTADELRASLAGQYRLLVPGGVALHSLWYGTQCERHAGLRFQQYTGETFAAVLDGLFVIESAARYAEESEDDSLAVVLRRKD